MHTKFGNKDYFQLSRNCQQCNVHRVWNAKQYIISSDPPSIYIHYQCEEKKISSNLRLFTSLNEIYELPVYQICCPCIYIHWLFYQVHPSYGYKKYVYWTHPPHQWSMDISLVGYPQPSSDTEVSKQSCFTGVIHANSICSIIQTVYSQLWSHGKLVPLMDRIQGAGKLCSSR